MLSHLRFLGQRCANVARTSSISLLQRPSFTTHLTTMKPVDIITYNATITACEKGGQWERALELFEEVKKHPRMEPDLYTYSATISACEKGGQRERALELFEEVKKHPRMEPDLYTYSATISACEKGRQWERALELFEEVKKSSNVANI
jgi:pentatricopeptide repeat domain-containing protein 1